MINGRLLIDFGSTFTKAVFVDLEKNEILARATHYSTVDTDINDGLDACLASISNDVGMVDLNTDEALACSSAAGGLRMVCVGFVPDYSMEAANLAALGAGAKVIACYSYQLTGSEAEEIEQLRPDIILLTGGTDGGNKKVIIHNAGMIASQQIPHSSIIVAGNKCAVDDIRQIFKAFGERVFYCANVMPEVGRIDVDDCNRLIREIFINNIIEAKGIGKARRKIKNVLMPTPLAVLKATRFLVDGCEEEKGLGEMIVVDLGGATTDVHSVALFRSSPGVVVRIGLPEPYEKRTVEGDLGLKYNLEHLAKLLQEKEPQTDVAGIVMKFRKDGFIPLKDEEIQWHTRLSRLAVETAVSRHVGRIEIKYGPGGEVLLQHGKDFRHIKAVIGTGGPIVFSKEPVKILGSAVFMENEPLVLKPRAPKFYLDEHYILFAGGLLGQENPAKALKFMKKHLKEL
ncbi:MAG: glutamate mutase L [Deltaproteobacteria bacterium]|nr:glutamate mutase L [Deltaproteobacteria bacterium]